MKTADLFDATGLPPELQDLLDSTWPWEVLARLDGFCGGISASLRGDVHPTAVVEGAVYLAPGASIGPHAYVKGPTWIGEGAEVGHGAYIRGNVVLAPGAALKHSCEAKRALFLVGAKAAHFNYVGDSVLGNRVNLGAGVKLANFKTFGNEIQVDGRATGLRKFGAAVGDDAVIGCNAVTSPGTLIGPRTLVYNGAMLRGVIPADSIVKLRQVLEVIPRRPT